MPPPPPGPSTPAPPATHDRAEQRLFLRVQGIVQGVGFRPYVARLARELNLRGHVANTSHGVEIEVQGTSDHVREFSERVRTEPPPMAQILGVEEQGAAPLPPNAEDGFAIRASRSEPTAAVIIPPDIATCAACRGEIDDPADRRHGYPFTNCTDCGPRYTIIREIPYDRERTGMAQFTMCPACTAEYADPESRRFHAQPNACPECGPKLRLLGPDAEPIPGDPLPEGARVVTDGGILALLGLGGFHLACDAENEDAVETLRRRKQRPVKPFAVMVRDLETARELAHVDPAAADLLGSPRAPIVLLPAAPGHGLAPGAAPGVAPGQDSLGLFLPYTPLHHLLFRTTGLRALVMTSGNRSDEPILATEQEARERLLRVADRFLVHDRPVVHRVDDSVVKQMGGAGQMVLRRARGYAPGPVPLANPDGQVILALGAELANAICVVRGGHAFLGPHNGDLKNLAVEDVFRAGVHHLLDLLQVQPDLVVCDLHPGYRSTALARELHARGIPLQQVQHHEAHAAGCMAEHGHAGDAVVLTLDGLGLGHDGTIWGGEILVGRPGRFRRAGHLTPVPQPGADRAAREPWRMAASHLRAALGAEWKTQPVPAFGDLDAADLDVLDAAMAQGINAPLTSSCGRLFDAAATVLGFRGAHRYSAQAPMELEALAARCTGDVAPYPAPEPAPQDGCLQLPGSELLLALHHDVARGRESAAAALAFHRGLARLFAHGAALVAAQSGLDSVFLTGGCTQNAVFLERLCRELSARGLTPLAHRQVPPNDGGIAYGQAAWCAGAGRRD